VLSNANVRTYIYVPTVCTYASTCVCAIGTQVKNRGVKRQVGGSLARDSRFGCVLILTSFPFRTFMLFVFLCLFSLFFSQAKKSV